MVRKTAKQKALRKPIKRRNKTLKNEPKFKMINSGFIKTISNINNKKSQNEINWDTSYDGKKASYHAKLNKDGKKKTINETFTNSEIEKLFGYTTINEPLEMRLKQLYSNNSPSQTPVVLNDENNALFIDSPRRNVGNMK